MDVLTTKGQKTSEYKACYHAFYAGVLIGILGVYLKVDLSALAGMIVAICAPLMWYAGNRTALKIKQGEKNEN